MRILLLIAVVVAAVPNTATAAERGIVTGRVLNETTGRPARGARVTLSGADEDGSGRITRTTTTSRDGRYRFDSLEAGTDWLYVVDARFDGGLFPGSPFRFPPGQEPQLQTSLKVWNTTTDPDSVLVTRDALFVLPAENSIGVVESVTVLNQTQLAYIGRGGMQGSDTTFGFGLPTGAGEVAIRDASLDVPELVATDFGFGITIALPPDESTFTYSYSVPADGSTYPLGKTALYPTADLLVFVGEPLTLESDRLRRSGSETLEGERYRRWEVPGLVDAGDTVVMQAVAEADIAWVPFAGGGAVLLILIVAAYLLARRRSPTKHLGAHPPDRDDLIAAIASLDLAYESGSVEKTDWESQRELLKTRLLELEKSR